MKKRRSIFAAGVVISLTILTASVAAQPTCYPEKEPRMAVKTNILYWIVLTPNVEAEFYVCDKLSVNADVQLAWWSSYEKGRYYQLLSVSPEIRYWFSEKSRFHGHYAGIYATSGLYDFMYKRSDNGYQGEFWGAGVSYGYTMPVSKCLSLEMGLGIGVLSTHYKRYVWDGDCYLKKEREQTVWFGPTKARVSLVWVLGKKGGRP